LGTNLTRGEQLGVQFLGIFVCFVWSFGATYLILRIINRFSPFRVTQEDEHIGLNVSEHGASTELVELFTVMDQQLRTQDMSLRAPEEPFTEVGQIAAQYNRVMEALEKVTARIKAIVTTAMDGIITFSKEGLLITTLNPAAETIFGYRETQIRNRPITLLIGPTEDGSPESEPRLIDSILSGTVAAGEYREMIGRRADGSTFLMEGVVTEAKESKETFYTATFRDITERKKQEELIRHMAYHDSLTGLPNRITFYDRLLVAIANAKRDKHIFAVIFIDLDRFKEINDTLGHETGDKVLQTVPRKMKEYLRESDTLSRMGGDEFMLLLPKIKTREDAQAVTEKFLEAFQKPLNINGHEITIGLSIGTSFYPQDGEEPDILVKKADTAMYQAKQSNKDNLK
jgi:Amt family ammonium transporter